MSWFSQAMQGSCQQPPPMSTAPPTGDNRSYPSLSKAPLAGQSWLGTPTRLASPSQVNFPPPPCSTAPPSLEDLSSSSLGVGAGGGHLPLSYVTRQEQQCVLSWFLGWGPSQRERFLQDLLSKAVPGKVCSLLEQLNTLQVRDRPPSIFECQLRLWSQWFESWSEEERNTFLHALEDKDPGFVAHFYRGVASTAGRD